MFGVLAAKEKHEKADLLMIAYCFDQMLQLLLFPLILLSSYCSRAVTNREKLLFESGFISSGKPADINDAWLNKVCTSNTSVSRTFLLLGRHSTYLQLTTMRRLKDSGSSMCCLSFLLSAVETSPNSL